LVSRDEPPSVAVGPFDTAGCASALAAGLEAEGTAVTLALASAHELGYGSARALTRRERLVFAARAPSRFSVLHYQFGRTWLPRQVDAVWARARGRLLAVSFYGDDCRQYGLARRLYPARGRVGDPSRDDAVRRRVRRLGRLCQAALVGDLELATYVLPHFRRVYVTPLPLESTPLAPRRPRPADAPYVVVHAPSDREVKGTRAIEVAARSASQRIPLELRILSGLPHAAVLTALGEADVAVDQLNSVTTGIFALEAMRAGVPVLSEFDTKALGPFQSEHPVVPVTAETLAAELEALLRHDARRQHLAAAGPEYVEGTHVAPFVAQAALSIYEHARGADTGLFEATAEGIRPLPGYEQRLRAAFASTVS
jgi:hypothetical protein